MPWPPWPGDLQILGSLPPLRPGRLPTAGPTACAAGGAAGDVQAAGDQGAVGWVLKWDMKPPNYGIFIVRISGSVDFWGSPEISDSDFLRGNPESPYGKPSGWLNPTRLVVQALSHLLCHQETNIDISLNLDAPPESLGRRDDQRLC